MKREMPKVAGDGGGGGRRSEDLRVVFLRVGAAVALSVAGLLLSRRRPRQQLRLPPPPPRSGINSRGVLFNVFFSFREEIPDFQMENKMKFQRKIGI